MGALTPTLSQGERGQATHPSPITHHPSPFRCSRLWAFVGLSVLASVTLTGCQQRTIRVTSEPTGAAAYLNDVEVGRTPVEVDFTWFGTYEVRLEMDGYETLLTSAEAEPPLHEEPGFDLLFMLLPGEERTEIDWHFELAPETRDTEGLVDRATALREQYRAASDEETGGSNGAPSDDQ